MEVMRNPELAKGRPSFTSILKYQLGFLLEQGWISENGGLWVFTINTNHPGVNLVHKLNSLRRVEKLHPIKSLPMFFEAPQTEWRKPFDFP